MIKFSSLLLGNILVSSVFAVIYGNGIMYRGFPELPGALFLFIVRHDGETACNLVYCNAFVLFFVSIGTVSAGIFLLRRRWHRLKCGC